MRNHKSMHPRLKTNVASEIRMVERRLQDARDALDRANTAREDARREESDAKEVTQSHFEESQHVHGQQPVLIGAESPSTHAYSGMHIAPPAERNRGSFAGCRRMRLQSARSGWHSWRSRTARRQRMSLSAMDRSWKLATPMSSGRM